MSGEPAPETGAETLSWLDASRLRFHWGGGPGPIHLTIEGERSLLRVQAKRAFPRSDPTRFVQLHTLGKGGRAEAVGILEDTASLSGADREALEECLRRSYVVPRITRIESALERRERVRWVVETDRGARVFEMDNPYDNVKLRADGGALLTDVVKNRYEVLSLAALDETSRAQIERYV